MQILFPMVADIGFYISLYFIYVSTLGGTFFRGPNGEIFTTENSGHFGKKLDTCFKRTIYKYDEGIWIGYKSYRMVKI